MWNTILVSGGRRRTSPGQGTTPDHWIRESHCLHNNMPTCVCPYNFTNPGTWLWTYSSWLGIVRTGFKLLCFFSPRRNGCGGFWQLFLFPSVVALWLFIFSGFVSGLWLHEEMSSQVIWSSWWRTSTYSPAGTSSGCYDLLKLYLILINSTQLNYKWLQPRTPELQYENYI